MKRHLTFRWCRTKKKRKRKDRDGGQSAEQTPLEGTLKTSVTTSDKPRSHTSEIFSFPGWVLATSIEDLRGPLYIITTYPDNPSCLTCNEITFRTSFRVITTTESTSPAAVLSVSEPNDVSQVFVSKPIPGSTTKICLTSAYQRYLSADKIGIPNCEREAIGPTEEWAVVAREDGFALQSAYDKFLAVGKDGTTARCDSEKVGSAEVFRIKCQAQFKSMPKRVKTDEELEAEMEENDLELEEIKKFHSHTLGKVVTSKEGLESLRRARKDGNLHEELLDRRSKLKSDKFCK
ncbi:FRG1-like family-domain-containing protein [Cladochytrium replicatum]|nr:FRG1-like family-domain-containing protein [Cladochytrium replicatum]